MKINSYFFLVLLTFISTCANDLKGEKGDAGQDASSNSYVRIHRPSYHSISDTVIAVDGSAASPVILKFGSDIVTSTSTLLCDVSKKGVGGLRDGLTITASTIYYLYGVKDSTSTALVADTNSPAIGPEGYSDWTYLGAFRTGTSAIVPSFSASAGRLLHSSRQSGVNHTGDTNWTMKTILVPDTAKFALGFLEIGHAAGLGYGGVSPVLSPAVDPPFFVTSSSTSNENSSYVECPLLAAQTVYIKTSNTANTVYYESVGWIEDPLEYP